MATYFSGEYFWISLIVVLLVGIGLRLAGQRQALWILLASIGFYIAIFSRNERELLVSLVFMVWQFGLIQLQLRRPKLKWTFMLSLLPLIMSKAFDAFHVHAITFIGISYMSFKCLQILFEIYDDLIHEMKWLDYIQFMLFFPTISSGPIDRSGRFLADLYTAQSKRAYLELVGTGVFRLILGIVYKFVLAITLFDLLNTIKTGHYWSDTLLYMYVYLFYLFFDFAGYSLMAVGVSNMLGINTPMNFKQPFLSVDIKDFWNRWHITLSTWLRDFVFSRLMMRFIRQKRFKSRVNAAMAAYMINMILMGLWHGFSIQYVLYGIYHGVLLSAYEYYQKKSKLYKKYKKHQVYRAVSWFVTFNLVAFGCLIFSGKFQEVVMKLIQIMGR